MDIKMINTELVTCLIMYRLGEYASQIQFHIGMQLSISTCIH